MIRKRQFPPADRLEHFYGKVELGADGAPTERWRKRTVTFVRTPWPFRLTWAPEVTVHRLPCHRQVTGPLQDALAAVAEEFPREEILSAGLDLFGGSQFFAIESAAGAREMTNDETRMTAERSETDCRRQPRRGEAGAESKGLRLSPHVWGAAFVLPGLFGEAKASKRALELFLEAGWAIDEERQRVAAVAAAPRPRSEPGGRNAPDSFPMEQPAAKPRRR